MSKDFIVHNINKDLHRDFKTACAWYEISMREILIKHMQNIVNDYRKDKRIYGEVEISKEKRRRK